MVAHEIYGRTDDLYLGETMINKFMASDDYAVFTVNNARFYYGYEVLTDESNEDKEEWCFKASFVNGADTIIPHSKLNTNDMFNVKENLMAGIGIVLNDMGFGASV